MRGGKYEGWLPNLFVGNLLQVSFWKRDEVQSRVRLNASCWG